MGPHKVDERLSEILRLKSLSDPKVLDEINELLRNKKLLKPVPVEVDRGHPDDWSARQILLNFGDAEPKKLKDLTSRLLEWLPDNKQLRARGLVIRLLAENDEQVGQLRSNVRKILDEALGASYWPLLIVRPQNPHPDLPDLLLKFYGLSLFTSSDIQDVGEAQYKEVLRGAKEQLKEALDQLERSGAYEAPEFFRHQLETLSPRQGLILRELYRMSYHKGPTKFYPQYKHTGSSNLTKAVSYVMVDLLSNNAGAPGALHKNDSVARGILNNFLMKEWQVLDDRQHLRVPTPASPLYHGWQALDNHFRVGSTGTKAESILKQLLNPPFGYDFNTLTLLFSAWYGYHRRDIEYFSIGGRTASIEQVIRDGKGNLKKPKDFVPDLRACFVTRRDISKHQRDIEGLIQRVQSGEGLRQAEARGVLRALENFVKDERANHDLQREAGKAFDELKKCWDIASDYDEKAVAIRRSMEGHLELSRLVGLLRETRALPETKRVQASEPRPHELIEQLNRQIAQATEQKCRKHEQLEKIDDYGLYKSTLENTRRLLKQEGLHELVERVDSALEALKRSRDEHKREENDARVFERLDQIQVKGSLAYLRGALEEIESLQIRSIEAGQKANEKLASIEAEIEKLESFAANCRERLEALTQLDDIRFLRDDLLKHFKLFEDTEEQKVVEAALDAADALESFFRELEALRNERAQDPEDVRELLQRCTTLEEEYADRLSRQQREQLKEVTEAIRQEAASERRLAVEWMTEREKVLAKADVDTQRLMQVLRELNSPPAFLPAAEQNRLHNCQREAQRRVDADEVVQVEIHFRNIADPEKKIECLRRLERLVEAPESL